MKTQFGLEKIISYGERFRFSLTHTGEESVELHQQLEVRIVALWRLAVRVANVMGIKINPRKRTT
jgi:hypothetical protein